MIVALVGASRLLAAELYMLLLLVVLASKPFDAQCAALHNLCVWEHVCYKSLFEFNLVLEL